LEAFGGIVVVVVVVEVTTYEEQAEARMSTASSREVRPIGAP